MTINKLDKQMLAITFAEYGEFDTALEFLKQRIRQRDRNRKTLNQRKRQRPRLRV